ncbi:YtpI family protein [Paenibacillus xylaniclasticus]|uniref:YtpI family protein n=1 Tax=Paenibacillus xylaniclasticus TaxID=588083 RepID=UPI000FD6F981|nr:MULTISPECIES: YtpI family protein [Paenibacillus]
MVVFHWILFIGIVVTSGLSVIYSFKARRATDMDDRGLYTAHMNIYMGIMLLLIALIQMLMYNGSTLLVIVGAVFMVLGLFNLFAGIRNRSFYSARKQQVSQ